MFGISSTRCGSPATIGRPVEVRSAEIAQLLLPPVEFRAHLVLRGRQQRRYAGLEIGERSGEPLSLHAGRHAQQVAAAVVEA